MILTKKCSKCKEVKPKEEGFCKNKAMVDGFANWCRQCLSTYRKENKKIVNERNRRYYHSQNEKCRETRRKQHHRRKNDARYKLPRMLRNRLHNALKYSYTKKKEYKTLSLLGCSIEELKQHIEAQFQPGMTWDNWSYKGWHLDHIRPLCTFDLTDPEQLKQACHYTNLQPLWGIDNMQKPNKIVEET